MITRQLDNGAAVEITTNAGFLRDGIQYEAFLSYNEGKRRIGIGTFNSITIAMKTAAYWNNIERKNKLQTR